MAYPLYLASASPRRRQILAEAGIPFELLLAPIDEERLAAEYRGPIGLLGEYLAEHKALEARARLIADGKHGHVLASDTTVLLDGESLAKPRDRAEARTMLARLRARTHVVATGIALAGTAAEAITTATSRTEVLMREYGESEVEAYVATGDPLDKAGSYSIQHPDFHPVARFAGCHLGVIGLPVCIVAALLGNGTLPPVRDNGRSCIWSPLCTAPLPTRDSVHRPPRSAETA